jgi:carbamoyl-phosphate synthase small subunit
LNNKLLKDIETPNTMNLILEDGSIFKGKSFGNETESIGEVVFNTSMTGYQEMLTDPSYSGQIVISTYPLIGNYGINKIDFESNKIQIAGFVIKNLCLEPSHNSSEFTLNEFLKSQSIPGVYDVDTRALTKKIRQKGVMSGKISKVNSTDKFFCELKNSTPYNQTNFVYKTSTDKNYNWESKSTNTSQKNIQKLKIVVMDFGLKYNILRVLESKGCEVIVVPANSTKEKILRLNPDGIVLSPGPGDPSLLNDIVNVVKQLPPQLPILGICLGNQILAQVFGAKTFKLKFGHRGSNHPVKDMKSGMINITSQNNGYSINAESLPSELEITHINLNDGTIEGMRHKTLPIMSIQFHSEASPGPKDNEYIFDDFLNLIEKK